MLIGNPGFQFAHHFHLQGHAGDKDEIGNPVRVLNHCLQQPIKFLFVHSETASTSLLPIIGK